MLPSTGLRSTTHRESKIAHIPKIIFTLSTAGLLFAAYIILNGLPSQNGSVDVQN